MNSDKARVVKPAEPRWELLPVPHLSELPGLRWTLRNVQELAKRPKEHQAAIERLKSILEI